MGAMAPSGVGSRLGFPKCEAEGLVREDGMFIALEYEGCGEGMLGRDMSRVRVV